MAILGQLLGYLVPAILSWFAAKFHSYMVDSQVAKAAETKTAAAAAAVAAAQTPQERESAAQKVSDNF